MNASSPNDHADPGYGGPALVLGGAGLVGRALVEGCRARGLEVAVADRVDPGLEGVEHVPVDLLRPGGLDQAFAARAPRLVFNAVNLATLFSTRRPEGYDGLLRFYTRLYARLAASPAPITYVQIGTTGSGGLGFDIPFTHGDRLEDLPIIHKAAYAGISSQLLVLIARSFPRARVRVVEVKPGLSIFDPEIRVQPVGEAVAVTVDGGESGAYTLDELALLTRYMGFTTPARVAEAVFTRLESPGETSFPTHDVVAAIDAAVLGASPEDESDLTTQLERMTACAGARRRLPATGNLGPPTVTRDLIAAAARLAGAAPGAAELREDVAFACATRPELAGFLEAVDWGASIESLGPFCAEATSPWEVVYGALRRRRE